MLAEFIEGVLAVADGSDPIVLALEIGGHGIANGLFILNK